MDRRGSTVITVNHRTHLEMKELSVKLHEKKGGLSGLRVCIAAFECGLSQDTRDQAEGIEDHMGTLDGRETKCLHSKIWRYGSIAPDRSR